MTSDSYNFASTLVTEMYLEKPMLTLY